MPNPLVIIPSYVTEPNDVKVTLEAIASVRKTALKGVDVLLVDDCSPNQALREELVSKADDMGALITVKEENEGFSRTVNVGLQLALDEGRDAVLVNADVEMDSINWDAYCKATEDGRGGLAWVVGALLLYPNGLIQHAGIYFSYLTRSFDHRHKYGPGDLPEALVPKICPVTGAFQYIRHECLQEIGLYDEGFNMGWEDVDYCLRVLLSGHACVYNPDIRAFHYETMFRGRKSEKVKKWERSSYARLHMKYAHISFENLLPAS